MKPGILDPKDVQAVLHAQAEGIPVSADIRRRWTRAAAKVNRIMRAMEEPMSLESPVGNEENSQLGDFIEDEDALEPMDAAAREMLRESVKNALAVLSDREREVLELRFGLVDGKDHTLEEVGQYFQRYPRAHPPDRSQSLAQAAPSDPQPAPARLSRLITPPALRPLC